MSWALAVVAAQQWAASHAALPLLVCSYIELVTEISCHSHCWSQFARNSSGRRQNRTEAEAGTVTDGLLLLFLLFQRHGLGAASLKAYSEELMEKMGQD